MDAWLGPTIIGGDFNLVRSREEKNIGVVNFHWVSLFKDRINKYGLIELKNYGRKFTWANNQGNLVMANIDKVFTSTYWESIFPSVQLKALPRVGSDHTPLVFDIRAIQPPKNKQFRFEKWWLEVEVRGYG
jgi:endonuclease/exonuclease/phosphatase family metal-dependent hydrolase